MYCFILRNRYIVLHAGCDQGFIPGAELVFSSKKHDGDYHGEMNETNFLKWFEHQLIKNLQKPSTIVMDNASYHSTITNKAPNTSSKKAEIQDWLASNNIVFDKKFFKTQLLELVAKYCFNKFNSVRKTRLIVIKYLKA